MKVVIEVLYTKTGNVQEYTHEVENEAQAERLVNATRYNVDTLVLSHYFISDKPDKIKPEEGNTVVFPDDFTMFDPKDLHGKTLKIIYVEEGDTNMLGGKDEQGNLYVLQLNRVVKD